jgi:signal transduction histidine kinase
LSGVTLPFDLEGTLDLALRLHPDRRHVAVVVGASRYDHAWLERARALFARRDDVRATYLTNRSVEQLERDVRELPDDAFVLYLAVTVDASGARVVSRDVAARVAAAASVLVYSFYGSNVGYGVVGASAPSFSEHSRAAAALAIRLMNGDATARGRIEAGPGPRCKVDARALARWRIAEASLPPGCEVAFREPTLWEQFGWYVVAALAIIALQAGLIAAPLLQRRRSRIAEAELSHERAVAAHAARLATLGELSATIAHEISQPLGAILSNADAGAMLLDSDDPGRVNEARQIFADIRRDDLRARDVVRRVRALAQHHALSLQPLDVNDVIDDTVRLIETDAARRGVAITLDLAAIPRVSGDRTQLQQVLINLMLNAMDAMTDSPPGRRRLSVRTRLAESRVEVCVSDTGPGVPADHLERLFESFFTTKAHGVGLGLAIARSILEAHAGNIRATNHANGAAFTFTLPALAESPRHVASAPPQPARAPT